MPQPNRAVRQRRIRSVSRLFRVLSLLALATTLGVVILLLFLPVVAVDKTYVTGWAGTNPVSNEASTAEPASSPGEEGDSPARNSAYLDLGGQVPSLAVFSYPPNPENSRVRADRVGVARSVGMVWMLYGVLGAWLFYKLFRTYESGRVLTLESARRLKSVGKWMIGKWLLGLLFAYSKVYWSTHAGFTFQLVDADLLCGLFLWLIAWIMEEAHEVAEEQALTV